MVLRAIRNALKWLRIALVRNKPEELHRISLRNSVEVAYGFKA
jgi:hypothetical protein